MAKSLALYFALCWPSLFIKNAAFAANLMLALLSISPSDRT
jgi:hypothetical protein